MARASRSDIRLDAPKGLRTSVLPRRSASDSDRFGRFTEWIARNMGTPWFIVGLTIFVIFWMAWNIFAPPAWRFDPYPFIFLTLMLSLQASYAAPLILLAQNRQDDRDRVQYEQDRARNERSIADTEYLTREVAALRVNLGEVATRDWIRSELEDRMRELELRRMIDAESDERDR